MATARGTLKRTRHTPHKRTEARRLLSSYQWTQLSIWYRRNHPTCEHCWERGTEEVHHKIPREVRPDLTFEESNLQALCGPCHRALEG